MGGSAAVASVCPRRVLERRRNEQATHHGCGGDHGCPGAHGVRGLLRSSFQPAAHQSRHALHARRARGDAVRRVARGAHAPAPGRRRRLLDRLTHQPGRPLPDPDLSVRLRRPEDAPCRRSVELLDLEGQEDRADDPSPLSSSARDPLPTTIPRTGSTASTCSSPRGSSHRRPNERLSSALVASDRGRPLSPPAEIAGGTSMVLANGLCRWASRRRPRSRNRSTRAGAPTEIISGRWRRPGPGE